MGKLYLQEFRCVEESDEIGDDSPYFVSFWGDTDGNNFGSKVIRKEAWDNDVSSGDLLVPNAFVAKVNTKTLVFMALMEEDYVLRTNDEVLGS